MQTKNMIFRKTTSVVNVAFIFKYRLMIMMMMMMMMKICWSL